MKNIYHKKRGKLFPKQMMFLGVVLGVVGTLNLLGILRYPDIDFVNVLFIIYCVLALTTTTGVKLDPDNKRYNIYVRIFMMPIGRWKILPPLDCVMISKIPHKKILRARGVELKYTESKYRLLLVTRYKRKIEISVGPHDTIIDEAIIFAKELDTKVVDSGGEVKEEIEF